MSALLEIRDLDVHYGVSHVLHGVDLDVNDGEVVTLLGRNGVGKSTLIHALTGIIPSSAGSIRFAGDEILGTPSHAIARGGIALVPQGRRIFARLTVEENLLMAGRSKRSGDWNLERVYELLPVLAERRRAGGTNLSGGEQQMLAIGRALLANPSLLVLDEPSEGLAPLIVKQIGDILAELRTAGIPALLVEQNLGMALRLADRVYIMEKGEIAYQGTTDDLRRDPGTARSLLGVS